MLPQVRYKKLSQVSGFQDFTDYIIDMDGNVWSYKNKKPRILKPHIIKNGYLKVPLWNSKGKRKQCYIHRLVALCFIPANENETVIIHKNGNLQDNKVENLEWHIRKIHKENVTILNEEKCYQVSKELSGKIEKVFYASQRKGLPNKNNDQFFTDLVNKALNDHINQYGLRKIDYSL
jgi:hypothetical protein